MTDRIYTEDEVRAIIQRAVELQEQTPAPAHGLTMDELERLGGEVGLDASYLRMAAAEVAKNGRTPQRRAEMTDTHVVVERWLDGPLSVAGWEDVVAMLRVRFGIDAGGYMGKSLSGQVETVGNAQEWTHTSGLGVETRVGVTERGERVRLRLSQRVGHGTPETEGKWYGVGAGVLVGLIAGGIVAGVTGLGGSAFLAASVVVSVLSAFVLAPLIEHWDRRWRQKKLTQLDALANDVAETLAAPVGVPAPSATATGSATPAAEPTPATSEPRLMLDEEAPLDTASAPSATGRVRN